MFKYGYDEMRNPIANTQVRYFKLGLEEKTNGLKTMVCQILGMGQAHKENLDLNHVRGKIQLMDQAMIQIW